MMKDVYTVSEWIMLRKMIERVGDVIDKDSKRKTIMIYVITAIAIILINGFIAGVLSMIEISESTIKIVADILSSIFGSIWLTFLLSRIIRRDFETKYDRKEVCRILCLSLILIVARVISLIIYHNVHNEVFGLIISILLAVVGLAGVIILHRRIF